MAAYLTDALGRPVPLAPPPRRILSLVPSVTEGLFDLGAGERVVGRTDYCVSPAGLVERLPSVGGPKSLDLERIARLAPDLVLANAEENEREQVQALIDRGARVHVAFPRTLAESADFLRDLGSLLGCGARAARFARRLEQTDSRVPAAPVATACLIWRDPFMTANGDTLTSALVAAAGGRNVFADLAPRYPTIDLDDLARRRPRVVLLPSEPYAFTSSDAREMESRLPGSAALCIPGEWVTWYGTRMDRAIEGLRDALGPFRGAGRLPRDTG